MPFGEDRAREGVGYQYNQIERERLLLETRLHYSHMPAYYDIRKRERNIRKAKYL